MGMEEKSEVIEESAGLSRRKGNAKLSLPPGGGKWFFPTEARFLISTFDPLETLLRARSPGPLTPAVA
jgi:hypothetical protein